MTDQELQELKAKYASLSAERTKIFNDYNDKCYKIIEEENIIENQIKDEEKRRLTESGFEGWKEKVKNFFETYEYAPKKVADELWMVEVNGKKLRSSKGKYTWTSENRAFRGICDYIYYNNYEIQHAIDSNELELGDIIESLIDEGYIKITRVV